MKKPKVLIRDWPAEIVLPPKTAAIISYEDGSHATFFPTEPHDGERVSWDSPAALLVAAVIITHPSLSSIRRDLILKASASIKRQQEEIV